MGARHMIMREWRGRVPQDKADDYEAFLHTSGIADFSATLGNRGACGFQFSESISPNRLPVAQR